LMFHCLGLYLLFPLDPAPPPPWPISFYSPPLREDPERDPPVRCWSTILSFFFLPVDPLLSFLLCFPILREKILPQYLAGLIFLFRSVGLIMAHFFLFFISNAALHPLWFPHFLPASDPICSLHSVFLFLHFLH